MWCLSSSASHLRHLSPTKSILANKIVIKLIIILFILLPDDYVVEAAGDKKKMLKPRIFVDFTRIADSGTRYSEPLAVADFGTIVEYHRDSHLFLVDQADRIAFEKVLRAVFPARKTGPDDSGGRFDVALLPSHHYTINYTVRFPHHFHWASGGMLPGLCGGSNSCYCGIEPNTFVVTTGWSPTGQVQLEVCARYTSDDDRYVKIITTNYTLSKGEWIDLTLDLKLNTPDRRDGFVAITVNNTFYEIMENVTFRSTSALQIDTFLYATFFANGERRAASSQGPVMDVYADFDDIAVVRAP